MNLCFENKIFSGKFFLEKTILNIDLSTSFTNNNDICMNFNFT